MFSSLYSIFSVEIVSLCIPKLPSIFPAFNCDRLSNRLSHLYFSDDRSPIPVGSKLSRILPSDFNYLDKKDIFDLLFDSSLNQNKYNILNFFQPLIFDKTDFDSKDVPLYNLNDQSTVHSKICPTIDFRCYLEVPEIMRAKSSCFECEILSSFINDCIADISSSSFLQDFDGSPHIFVDLSTISVPFDQFIFSFPKMDFASPQSKLMMVRNLDGVLKEASRMERTRMLKIILCNNHYLLIQNYISHSLERKTSFNRELCEELEIFNNKSILEGLLISQEYVYVLDILSNRFQPDSEIYIHLHYWVCRHLILNRKFSLLINTRHFTEFMWWILIGEMEDIGGLNIFLKWCEEYDHLKTIECFEKLYNILTGFGKELREDYVSTK